MLEFFQSSIGTPCRTLPNDYFRDMQQAKIDEQWDDTSARYTVMEQKSIGSEIFKEIEVWVDYVVGQTSGGLKNGDDFRQYMFRDITHKVPRGLYYMQDDNYWITYFTNDYDSLCKSIAVRRCNNFLRIIDPENGAVYSAPCVVEYDMASPSIQVSSSILTPNNHATVMVQGNEDTLRLFKLNTRYILGGRPFKLYAYQNAIMDDVSSPSATLLYLDLYLDEEHAKDDRVNQLADNGEYNYVVKIDSTDSKLFKDATGSIGASVTLNGREVNREIEWCSNNTSVVQVDQNGKFTVVGEIGQTAVITATLVGNANVYDSISVAVVGEESITPVVYLDPAFDHIKQYENIDFSVYVDYGGTIYDKFDTVTVSLSEDKQVTETDYLSLNQIDGVYRLTGKKISPEPQNIYVHVSSSAPVIDINYVQSIDVNSMFG